MKISVKYFFWGLLFFTVAYLIPIAGRPLMRPDEFRYGEIPREMIQTGDFVTPRLLRVRYFEKPVLGYWITAGSFKLFGFNRFALRLPMALAAGLTALLLGLWIKRVSRDPEWGLWAAVFFLATGLGWGVGTTAVLDSILALFTTATLICVHQAVTTEKWNFERVIWLVLCGVTAGLGFMTKGFVAWAVPGTATVAYLVWTKRYMALLWLPWIPLLALAATVLPWALEIHRAEPDFWHYFVVVEHLQRFRSSEETQHPEPFWYYLPMLLTLFPALFSVLHGAAAGKDKWKKVWRDDLWRFALCSVLLPFCFFSASKGKLATYILPCFPFAAAVLTLPALEALRAERREAKTAFRLIFDIVGWMFVVLGAAGIAFGLALLPPVSLWRYIPDLEGAHLLFILLGTATAAGGVWQLRHRNSPRDRIAGFFGFAALGFATFAAIPEANSFKMPEHDLRLLAASGEFSTRGAMIFSYGGMGHAVAWSLNRPDTKMLFSDGELGYGSKYAELEGDPLLWEHKHNGNFARLVRDPGRMKQVVYISTTDEFGRYRYIWLMKFKPRQVIRGNMLALVFDPVTSPPVPEPPPGQPAPAVPAPPAR